MKQLSENDAYENYYQFVGATKYRKPLFYDNEIRDRLSTVSYTHMTLPTIA